MREAKRVAWGLSSRLGFLPGLVGSEAIYDGADTTRRLAGRVVASVLGYFRTGSGPGRAGSTVHGECGVRVHVTNVTCCASTFFFRPCVRWQRESRPEIMRQLGGN